MFFPYVDFKSTGIIPPDILCDRYIIIDDSRPTLNHQWDCLLKPFLEMTGLAVDRSCLLGLEHLDERETCRVINLLDDIEPHASFLAPACFSVLTRDLPESFYIFLLDMTVNKDNIHEVLLLAGSQPEKRFAICR